MTTARTTLAMLAFSLVLCGCSVRMLDFTLLSSKNVEMRVPQEAKGTRVTGIDTVLGATENALVRLDTAAGNARARVDAFDEAVATAGEKFVENPVLLTAISERLDLGIGPGKDSDIL